MSFGEKDCNYGWTKQYYNIMYRFERQAKREGRAGWGSCCKTPTGKRQGWNTFFNHRHASRLDGIRLFVPCQHYPSHHCHHHNCNPFLLILEIIWSLQCHLYVILQYIRQLEQFRIDKSCQICLTKTQVSFMKHTQCINFDCVVLPDQTFQASFVGTMSDIGALRKTCWRYFNVLRNQKMKTHTEEVFSAMAENYAVNSFSSFILCGWPQ